MTKSQVVLVVISIAAVVLLFNLPKKALKDGKSEKVTQPTAGSSPSASHDDTHASHDHAPDLMEDEKILIAKLKKALVNEGVLNKKVTLADSVAAKYRQNFMYDSAAKYYDIEIQLKPSKSSLVKAGDNYYEAFNFTTDEKRSTAYAEKAREIYQQLLQQYPEDLDLKSKMAMTFVASPNPMQGILMLREVLAKDANHELAIYNLGVLSVQSGQYQKAVDRFTQLAKVNPTNAKAYFYLGVCYKELGDAVKAKINFEKVKNLEKDPSVIATVDGYLKELK
jgi:tetratricopeptide (TPR) repeat protein